MKHILVMEDDVDTGPLFKGLLEDEGYQVTLISNPNDALTALKAETYFDFVWSDGMGWKKCYMAAVEKYGREKVLVYTGSSELVADLTKLGIISFRKDACDEDEGRTFFGLLDEIKQILPL